MDDFVIGSFAAAAAGHDTGKCYVIFHMDSEYVYLVDGRSRTIERPKKKKKNHIILRSAADHILADKIRDKSVTNEEIKRAIKQILSKEDIGCQKRMLLKSKEQ